MTRPSRSSAIYARLLALYPREMRCRHRAEMLQNFDDLERASSSTLALWLVIGRDLVTSVVLGSSEGAFMRQSRVVAAVLVLIVAIAWRSHSGHEPVIWTFCGGYAIGWVSGWSRRRAVVAFTLLGIALAASADQRFLLAVCYGCTLGWVAGWVGKRRSASTLFM